jgi:RNA polymerase sigma-70 factor (ECF subfamily)
MSEANLASAVPHDLIRRLQAREEGAFEEFLSLVGPRLLNFGFRMCGDHEDARDVLQETLLKTFESVGDLQHPEAFRTWLYRIASNACLMKRRKSKFMKEELALEEILPDPGQLQDPSGWEGVPERAVLDQELRERLREAVLELPPLYKTVLVLRDMEGLETEEVSRALGVSKDVVKMRLHRARAKVRQSLEAFLHQPSPA